MEQFEDDNRQKPQEKRVLIVDDDVDFRKFLETAVSREGFQVSTVAEGGTAASRVKEYAPDLIILDMMLPGRGGYEILQQLQTMDLGHIPVIIVTGRFNDPSTVEMIRREGNVVDFLSKPVKIQALGMALHNVLKTRPGA